MYAKLGLTGFEFEEVQIVEAPVFLLGVPVLQFVIVGPIFLTRKMKQTKKEISISLLGKSLAPLRVMRSVFCEPGRNRLPGRLGAVSGVNS